jgi:hypothetical protein
MYQISDFAVNHTKGLCKWITYYTFIIFKLLLALFYLQNFLSFYFLFFTNYYFLHLWIILFFFFLWPTKPTCGELDYHVHEVRFTCQGRCIHSREFFDRLLVIIAPHSLFTLGELGHFQTFFLAAYDGAICHNIECLPRAEWWLVQKVDHVAGSSRSTLAKRLG